MNKRFYLWMTLLFLTSGMCVQAEEEAVWEYDDLNMRLKLEGEVSGEVEVPSEMDGYVMKALGSSAFFDQQNVTSIILPDCMEVLQSGSIGSLNGLEKVRLSENLTIIESGNFSSCPALTSITIPPSVSYIESSLYWCDQLKEIRFEGVCPIFEGNDWNFDGLPEDCVIYVPDDQLSSYQEALADVNGAAERLQPSGQNAVTVDFTAPEEDFEFDASAGMITGYTGSSARLEIPAEIGGVPVRAIGDEAFQSCYSVYYLMIPEGVESVGNSSFYQSSNLEYIHFPSTLRTIGEEAFFNAQAVRVDWQEGLEEIGPKAFYSDFETILSLPPTVKKIGEGAFESSRCTELYLGGDLKQIGSRAFANASLSYMAFDFYEAIDIAADAFVGNAVYDLDLPWDSSFENRDKYEALLKEQCPDCTVWINNPNSGGVADYPENVGETKITDGVWESYEGTVPDLTVWTVYDNIDVYALGDGVFRGNQNIRSFYPHHCGWFTTIGNEAFADSSVEYVELFGSITTIGEEAFRNCQNITELTIPASVTSIGRGALEGCTNLKKLTILCDASALPPDFLTGCTGLEEVYASADASEEQIEAISAAVGYPWYSPVPREGEARYELQVMPYEPLPGEDFWYDEEYKRLDTYNGYEVNLILPREIDQVPLTMIGGGMMGRAAYGDNYEMELPVRSVVIPETYTEIPAAAFQNCETLETVICYGPIENLVSSTFSNCTNLREIVFVNGVRNVDERVFVGCTALETVYLGEHTEHVSPDAFKNEDESFVFELENCLTSHDQMPDVDKLLEAVKSDPIPEPEPETELVAVPVGEEGKAFFGTWYGTTMEMGGEVLELEAYGITMQITLNEDGTAELFDGELTDQCAWSVTDEIARINNTMQGSLTETGELCLEEEGAKLYFTQEIPEHASQPEQEAQVEPETEPQAQSENVVRPEPAIQEEPDQPETNADLFEHRQTLQDTDSICGVVFIGYVDGSHWYDKNSIDEILRDSGYLEEFQFISDIPEVRTVQTEYGNELYCIFPYDQNASVSVNEYVYDGPDDYVGRTGDVLYHSEFGDPILLRCNVSEIMRDTEICIVDPDGSVLNWQPGISLYDGNVDVPLDPPYVYNAAYIWPDEDYFEPNSGPTNRKMQVVNCQEWVSLREFAYVESERIDTVPRGTIVDNCYYAGNDFYYVEYNGLGGFVHCDYLAEIGTSGDEGSEYPDYEEEDNGYLFGMAGEWRTNTQTQENGTDIVYRLHFLTDETGVEGNLIFSFDDPWTGGVSTWYGTYFPYDTEAYTCCNYMYFLESDDGTRYGEIFVSLENGALTITEVSGDAFWPFTSHSTETLWFYSY